MASKPKKRSREELLAEQARLRGQSLREQGYRETSPGVYGGSPIERMATRAGRAVGRVAGATLDTVKPYADAAMQANQRAIDTITSPFTSEYVNVGQAPAMPMPMQGGLAPRTVDAYIRQASDAGGLGKALMPNVPAPSPNTAPAYSPTPANAPKTQQDRSGTIYGAKSGLTAEQGQSQVRSLMNAARADGSLVPRSEQTGGITTGSGGVNGTYSAFASYSPAQMAAFKATNAKTLRNDKVKSFLTGAKTASTGASTPSAQPGMANTQAPATTPSSANPMPKPPVSFDMEANMKKAQMKAMADMGVSGGAPRITNSLGINRNPYKAIGSGFSQDPANAYNQARAKSQQTFSQIGAPPNLPPKAYESRKPETGGGIRMNLAMPMGFNAPRIETNYGA